nr:MAG TPA: peptidase [Caudoviricetes sp.]
METLYFDFENDMFNSDTAKALRINNATNNPKILTRLLQLIWYMLNPLRVFLGVPIIIECAYRCPALNKILGGASTGHPEGYCADIKVNGWTQEKLFNEIVKLIRCGKIKEYDQIIWEKDSNCVHVSYRHKNNRKQIKTRTKQNGKLVYTNV